jgi:hypothetical protein
MRKAHHLVACSSSVQPNLQPSGQLSGRPVLLSSGTNSRNVPASKPGHVSCGRLIRSQPIPTFVPVLQWKFGLRFRQCFRLLRCFVCFIIILDIIIPTPPIIRPQTRHCGTPSIRLAKSRVLVHVTIANPQIGKLLSATISTCSDAAAPGLLDSLQRWNRPVSSLYSYFSFIFHSKITTARRLRRNRKVRCRVQRGYP